MTVTYTTRSGSKLELRAVPSLLLVAVMKQIPAPQVPTFLNEAKGRTEENPSDPEYLRAVADHQEQMGMRTNDAMLANGVKVLELGPEVQTLESNDWAERLTFSGLVVPESGVAREVAWLRWHVLDDTDSMEVLKHIASAGGLVAEDVVQDAVDSFRNNEDGDSNTEVPIEIASRRRD